MKRNCILTIIGVALLVLLSAKAFSQSTIEVTVTNIKELKGTIRVALFTQSEDFPNNKPVKGQIVKITGKTMKVGFENVAAGIYAISVIHDENENEKLDTGFMGIPKEGFGFSNDAMGTFGPPKFKEASFSIPEIKAASITLKYM
jgi:uncharacterized protein (DUF2141 family)